MAITTMNTTTGANFIPEVWSDGVIEAAESLLVAANVCNRAYEGDIKGKGDTVRIPSISNLSANDKQAGTAVTVQAPTEGITTLSINKHKEVSFYVEDLLATQAQAELRSKYTSKAGYALAKAIDTDLLDLYATFSQSAGDGTTAITDDIILNGMMQLDQADVPPNERVMILAPSQKANMLKLEKFVGNTYRNGKDAPAVSGVIGEIYGMDVYVTNQVAVADSKANNLMMHKDAMSLAIQMEIRLQAQYKLEYLSWLVVGDVIYGVGELQDDHCVVLNTTNVAPTSA